MDEAWICAPSRGKVTSMPWVYSPHSGGKKIPKPVEERTRKRILQHAEKRYAGRYRTIEVRVRGQFCYIDAYTEPTLGEDFPPPGWDETREEALERMRNTPTHLCRLRYHGDENRWSLAFFTYSHEKYEPCVFHSGEHRGTPEEALDVGAVYLDD
jgi:hypothetical protein